VVFMIGLSGSVHRARVAGRWRRRRAACLSSRTRSTARDQQRGEE
jgi:hypothetical protein